MTTLCLQRPRLRTGLLSYSWPATEFLLSRAFILEEMIFLNINSVDSGEIALFRIETTPLQPDTCGGDVEKNNIKCCPWA